MIFLIIFIGLTIISQVILKAESIKKSNASTKNYLKFMLLNPKILLAYSISLINIFIWIFALTKLSLLTAFMFTSVTYILMLLVDFIFFKEQINYIRLIGGFSITIGLIASII